MGDQRYEYYCDVVETGRFDALHANLNDMGRKGWRLMHVVHHSGDFVQRGELLLVWERPIQATGGRGPATEEGGPDG